MSVASILQEVLPTAEQNNASINIEAAFGHLCHACYTLNRPFRLVDSPCLGVVMDPSHLYLYDRGFFTIEFESCITKSPGTSGLTPVTGP